MLGMKDEGVWYTSAKTGEGVSELFKSVARYILVLPKDDHIEHLEIGEEKEEKSCNRCII